MTRVSAGLFDELKMDKTLLLNLELKRSERRRNLRYRTSVALDPENVPVAKVPEKIQKRFETFGPRFDSWFLGCAFLRIFFSNFSCMYLNPNIFFQFEFQLF